MGHASRRVIGLVYAGDADGTAIEVWPAGTRGEGWKAEKVHNRPPHAGFGLVRGWIENQTTIEIGGREMREQYERFFRDVLNRAKDRA